MGRFSYPRGMAKTYTATMQIRCWKRHQCVGCGGSYSYEFVRQIKGTGPTAEKASAKAEINRRKALTDDTDLHPCPTCGLHQPDMIGQRRARRSWIVFWCALPAFIICLVLASDHGLQYYILSWVVAAICALAAGALWVIALWNPNRDLSANCTRAAEGVAKGRLLRQTGQISTEVEKWAHPPKSPFEIAILLLVIAAVVAITLPEIARTSRNWPINPEAYPPVVGPGDQTRIYLLEKIDSIKSYWRGEAVVQFRDGSRTYRVTAKTNQNDWGYTIMSKSSEQHTGSTPWVEVVVPAESSLAGKVIDSDITLAVRYPYANGSGTYTTLDKTMQRSVSLTLAPPGAGAAYMILWQRGTLAGMGLILLCSIVSVCLARALRRRAHATEVFAAPGNVPR